MGPEVSERVGEAEIGRGGDEVKVLEGTTVEANDATMDDVADGHTHVVGVGHEVEFAEVVVEGEEVGVVENDFVLDGKVSKGAGEGADTREELVVGFGEDVECGDAGTHQDSEIGGA